MDIQNNVFLVTGGGSGLGAVTARMLIDNGGIAILADINEAAGEATPPVTKLGAGIAETNRKGREAVSLAGRERPPAVIDPLRKSVFVCGGEVYVRFHVRSPVFGGCRCHVITRNAPWSPFAW